MKKIYLLFKNQSHLLNTMPVFQATTCEAFQLKVLADLMSGCLKVGCFILSDKGISLCQADGTEQTLINLMLDSENFSPFIFKSSKLKQDTPFYLGLNLTHLHKMLKNVKKKDSLKLIIRNVDSNELEIETIPVKEGGKITTSFVKILRQQCLDIEVPTGYGKPIKLDQANDFQKMIKDMQNIGPKIKMVAGEHFIRFECDSGCGVLKRHVTFGNQNLRIESSDERDSSDSNSDSDSDSEDCYSKKEIVHEFLIDQFTRIAKIASLGTSIKFFTHPDLPLKIVSSIGTLGYIQLFIKSQDQIRDTDF